MQASARNILIRRRAVILPGSPAARQAGREDARRDIDMKKSKISDARIIAALEGGIPLEKEPFASIASDLGMRTNDLLARIKALMASGAVRRIGAVLDRRALGSATTLVAAKAARGKEPAAIRLINSYMEVTHHYRRAGADLDLWFTIASPQRAGLDEIISDLKASDLFERLLEFPATRRFKAEAIFSRMAGAAGNG
jgi:DNA-binding Lrp family transcriptional regulator